MLNTEFLSCAGSRWDSLLASPVALAEAMVGDDAMVQAAAVVAAVVAAAEVMASRREISGWVDSATVALMQQYSRHTISNSKKVAMMTARIGG
mmetsp:Transcript_34981/g.73793  ORF Transcript_34981/g.73793 Transcript_34981/m.73793 type:complete len:93 (-) Transcript_34981:88-366(-)